MDRPASDLDTAMALGMASTAIPFARSREAQAERWLRVLRMYGPAGAALQALGVSEAPLEGHPDETGPGLRAEEDVVASVSAAAEAVASRRGARELDTSDVLIAVMDFYGEDFDHVLRAHGTDREEVLERLSLKAA